MTGRQSTGRPPALLLAEALVMLALASLLIAILPFRRVAALSARGQQGRPASAGEAARLSRAVAAWGRQVPWRAVCFQQGLAAQFMLRRRGLAARLHYGARRDETGTLVAHVWVRSGDVDVIGCDRVERYGLLAVFPPA
ncbi:lasso peptide biosynthesis B2 protein [uncultured Sphingomonas sp.]|uniref:lasso peptide biosynthesis B2 protein n=1 Tax=uncultured Sphingomonas sp. TaxID=158754 RepID=UPI0025E39B18|nr:lasso peptide biosynthesis B2 protein [uncultured Sphingomonas sp.]